MFCSEAMLEFSAIGLNARLFCGFFSFSCSLTVFSWRRKLFAAANPLMNLRDWRLGLIFEFWRILRTYIRLYTQVEEAERSLEIFIDIIGQCTKPTTANNSSFGSPSNTQCGQTAGPTTNLDSLTTELVPLIECRHH